MGERNKRTKLKKSMGPGSIWAVAVGSIIGWGCFTDYYDNSGSRQKQDV